MHKLLKGLHQFHSEIFLSDKELFERLAQGQKPEALFITCSDSRIDPNLITQTKPGEIFVLRNAGNIVPPYSFSGSGEAATVEYALAALNIKDIIICGHSHCGAVSALIKKKTEGLPAVTKWLKNAEACRNIVMENYKDLSPEDLLSVAVQENVLVQLENLKSHPMVAERLAKNEVNLHGWVYKFETGEVYGYEPENGQFAPITGTKSLNENIVRR